MLAHFRRPAAFALTLALATSGMPLSAVAEVVRADEVAGDATHLLYRLGREGADSLAEALAVEADQAVENADTSAVAGTAETGALLANLSSEADEAASWMAFVADTNEDADTQDGEAAGEDALTALDEDDEALPALTQIDLRFSDDTRGVSLRTRDESGTWDEAWVAEDEQGIASVGGHAITGVEVELAGEAAARYDVWYQAALADGTWLEAVKAAEPDADEADAADGEKTPSQLVAENGAELCDLRIALVDEGAPMPEDFAAAVADKAAEDVVSDVEVTDFATAQDATADGAASATDEATSATDAEAAPELAETASLSTSSLDLPAASAAPSAQSLSAQLSTSKVRAQSTELTVYDLAPVSANTLAGALSLDESPTNTRSYATGSVDDQGIALQAASLEAQAEKWQRLYGADRYQTMANVAATGFASSNWAVVASGQNFPDALVAASLAGVRNCPIVLTGKESLSSQAIQTLSSLGVSNIYLMGGTGALSENVESSLVNRGYNVVRVQGANRNATSVAALSYLRTAGSTASSVVVVSGESFADALSIGPWAYTTKSPIILAGSDGLLTSAQVNAISNDPYIKRVILVGGTSVLKDQIKNQLGLASSQFLRLAGADRYETNRAVMDWAVRNGLAWSRPAIASGTNYPDALVGAALCGKYKSPVVLNSAKTLALVASHQPVIVRGYLLGGTAVVPDLPAITSGGQLNGVDISGWDRVEDEDGEVTYVNAASIPGDFVIIKATEGMSGTIYNPEYKTMANQALAAGKYVGFYHYANGGNAVEEADAFYAAIKDYKGRAIACLDWEGQGNDLFRTGSDALWCRTFLDELQSKFGGTPYLYTSKNVTNDYNWTSVASRYPLWGAQYPNYDPIVGYESDPWQSQAQWGAWGVRPTIFQYSSSGVLDSDIDIEFFDLNLFYGSKATWELFLR